MPTVSVIIPTFNHANFLPFALQSLIDQTYRDFEVLVIDDGSIDGSAEIVKDYCSKDPRFSYYYQENKGRSAARNYGLEMARGKYITFLDSDDVYLPEKIEKQVQVLDTDPQIGWVYCLYSYMNEQGALLDIKTRDYSFAGNIYPDIIFFKGNIVTTPGVMLRRALLEKAGLFDEKMDICEDLDLWRRISKFALIAQIKEKLVWVRRRVNEDYPLWDYLTAHEYFYKKVMIDDPELYAEIRIPLHAEMYIRYAFWGLRKGMLIYSTNLLIKLFCLGPITLKYLWKIFQTKSNPSLTIR